MPPELDKSSLNLKQKKILKKKNSELKDKKNKEGQ